MPMKLLIKSSQHDGIVGRRRIARKIDGKTIHRTDGRVRNDNARCGTIIVDKFSHVLDFCVGSAAGSGSDESHGGIGGRRPAIKWIGFDVGHVTGIRSGAVTFRTTTESRSAKKQD